MSGELAMAVVGLGFGANHARVLSSLQGVHLAAVCDTDDARLATAATGRDLRAFSNYETMFGELRLDAVVIAVPAGLHERVAIAAIGAGCAVLVEKPLAPSLIEGRRLVEATTRASVALMPGHIERFNPALQELRRRVQAGEIGRVLQVTARRMGPMVVNTRDVNVVYDSALHDIDAMRWLVGSEVERVFAEARSDLHVVGEDSLLGLLRFAGDKEQAGALGSLDVNWLAPRRIRDLNVRGEKGLFALDYTAQTLDFYKYGGTLPIGSRGWSPTGEGARDDGVRIPIEPMEPLKQELLAFVAALRDGAPMPVTADDALAALSVCDALTESARTGLPVSPIPLR